MEYYSNAGGISPVAGILAFPGIPHDAGIPAVAVVKRLNS
jgi:hypothetical protein